MVNGQWRMGLQPLLHPPEFSMSIESYKDLEIRQFGMELTKECYFLTRQFPREVMFGLTSQSRRAAASHLLLAAEVDVCKASAAAPLLQQADRIGRMHRSLIRRLQERRKR
jgi:hypothetical protein